jgi:hypothetical protein
MYAIMYKLTAALSGIKRSPRTSTNREAIVVAWFVSGLFKMVDF